MSTDLASLSDDALLAQLRSSGSGGSGPAGAVPGSPPPVAMQSVSRLSNDELMQHLVASADPTSRDRAPPTFDDRFNAAPMASKTDISGGLGAGLRGKADEMLVGKPDGVNQAAAGVINAANAAGFNIPKAGGALAATALGKVGLGPDRTYAQNYELAGEQADALSRQFPKTSLAGTVAGIGAGAVTLPGFQAAKGAGLAGQAVAAAGTGAAYGAAGSLLDAKDAAEVGKGALIGGVAGGVLAPVASKAMDALAPFFAKGVSTRNSAGQFTDEARALLTRSGINPDTIDHKTERALLDAFEKGGATDAALNEGRAAAQGISLTKGQAAGDYAQQQGEALAARNGENAGQKALGDFLNTQQEQVAARQRGIGEELAGGKTAVESPYDAGEMVAARARAAADNAAHRASESDGLANAALTNLRTHQDALTAGGTVATRARQIASDAAGAEQSALQTGEQALAGARGAGDALDNASVITQGVRDRAATARQGFKGAYDEAAAEPGQFAQGTFNKTRQAVENNLSLRDNPVALDGQLTPAASRAMDDLGRMPQLADPENIGSSMRDVDQFRKRLVSWYRAAQTPTDKAAVTQIINAFDDHISGSMDAGLFSGSSDALGKYQTARGLFRDYQQTFRPQGAGDDVGTAVRQIVERDARPDEVSRIIFGNPGSGNVGRSLRIADRLEKVLGPESPEMTSLRQGLVSRITGGTNMAPEAVSARIEQGLTGPGRQLADRLLTEEQKTGLRAYQDAVRRASAAQTSTPAWVHDLAAADFDPQRVAERLYGSTIAGRSSSSQYADGLKTFFGANSPEWTAIGQGYVSHILGGAELGADAISRRVSAALAPENRMFAQKMLTPDQIKGLEAVRSGINTAKLTRESLPEWIGDLAKGDFDPRRVVDKMFGGAAPGSNAAAAQYTAGLKGFLGKDSPEWAAVRQAGWQQLVNKPADHIGDYGAQAQANRISEFLNAKGKTLANVLYTPQEIAQMRDYATVMKMLVPQRLAGGSASPNSDTAPAAAALLRRVSAKGNVIATGLLGSGLATGGIGRAAVGWAFGKGLAKGADVVQNRIERRFANDAIAGAPTPKATRPANAVATAPSGVSSGLLADQTQ